jgi:phosphomannomutase
VLPEYVEKVMSFIDPSVIKPFKVVLDAGSGMGGLVAPALFDRLALQDDEAVLRHRRHVPEPRGQSPHRGEPARHHRKR